MSKSSSPSTCPRPRRSDRRETMDTWDMIAEERTSLVEALAALPADAWDKPSLLPGWTVRDVVAHMIATAEMTPPKFFAGMIGSGFKFNKFSEKNIARVEAGR